MSSAIGITLSKKLPVNTTDRHKVYEAIAQLQSSWERTVPSGTLEKSGSSGQTLQIHVNGTALAWRRFLNSGNSYNFHKYVM